MMSVSGTYGLMMCGELAMTKRRCSGRDIDVLAKEEVIPIIESLDSRIKILEAQLENANKVIKNWLDFEQWSVEMHGDYHGAKIKNLIINGQNYLKKIEGKEG